jgi:two-component system response regulator HydG
VVEADTRNRIYTRPCTFRSRSPEDSLTLADVDVAPVARAFGFPNIIGNSSAMREAVKLATSVASARRTTVLLIGETGTGKELFSRGIHHASSSSNEPFVTINCAAIPEQLLESELFGHEKGAFPGAYSRKNGLLELAGHGTLLIDEVHTLPRSLQPKLLQALESRRIRRVGGHDEYSAECRIIAAATPHLEQAVASGEFREDLYYRLNVFSIVLPPLRERLDDIEMTAQYFLNAKTPQDQRPKEFSPDAIAALIVHRWPGNVRELRTVIERAAILSGGAPTVRPEHLLIQRRTTHEAVPDERGGEITIPPGGKLLEDVEREAVALTLKVTGGNQTAAAKILGISRPTLAKKMGRPAPSQIRPRKS